MLLSLSDLDQQLRSANVPEWAINHAAGAKWKWSNVGTAPIMPSTASATLQSTKQQSSNADPMTINKAGGISKPKGNAETIAATVASPLAYDPADVTNQHHSDEHTFVHAASGPHTCSAEPSNHLSSHMGKHQQGSPNPIKPYHASSPPHRATWHTPISRSPSPPHVTNARVAPQTYLRSVSPSVARACITLPGFFPPVGASETTNARITPGNQCGVPFPPGTPMQQPQRQRQTAVVQQQFLAPTLREHEKGHNAASAVAHEMASVSRMSASVDPSVGSIDGQLKPWDAAGAVYKDSRVATPDGGSVQSWLGQIALPKVWTSCVHA